ncbi:P-loop containing nucleoside triphosphate hydrolase protein, partial [Exidia glandulosa HHB12029]
MPKRTSGALSDGGEDASPSAKRSKLGDATNKNVKGQKDPKQKKQQQQQQQAEEEPVGSDDEGDMVGNDDARLDERIGEMVRRKLEAQEGKAGHIAESGVIETLYMENFMCHARLSFKFGPQMNFIIGHNGSGKSAALSALTIALGGKTGSTGRGNGLKGFIKEGANSSLVRVGIKNQGDDAFLPDKYGPRLFVERRFTREGSSAYKIYSGTEKEEFKPAKVESTKRKDLDAICDHMNIQVDNPLNILTQDSARQFLSASNARDKYKFFMEGTQLQQLADSYTLLEEKIANLKRQGDARQEGLKDVKDKLQRAVARFETAQRAREMKNEMDRMEGELAWAHVAGKREQVEEAFKPLKKARRNLEKLTTALSAAQADVEAANAALEAIEQDIPTVSPEEEQEHEELVQKIRKLGRDVAEVNVEIKACDATLGAVKRQILDYDRQIAEEQAKLEAQTQGVMASFHARIESKKLDIASLTDSIATLESSIAQHESSRDQYKNAGTAADAERGRLRDTFGRIDAGIASANQSKKNALAVYGRSTEEIRAAIARQQWVGEVPLGPVGTHVEIADPEVGRMYGGVLRNVLGNALFGYVVSDARDLKPLKAILNHYRAPNPVTVAPIDIFDYSAGEPPADVLTMLRALRINNEWVKRVLINALHIENAALAPSRAEAQSLAERYDLRRVFTADERLVKTFGDGGGETTNMNRMGQNDPKSLLLQTGKEVDSFIERSRREMKDVEAKIAELNTAVTQNRALYGTATQQWQAAKVQLDNTRRQLTRERAELSRIENEANAAAPVSVSGLEDARKLAEAEKANVLEQFETMMGRKTQLSAELKPLTERKEVLRLLKERVQNEAMEIGRKVNAAAENKMQKQKNVTHWEGKKRQTEGEIADHEKQVEILSKELLQWSEKAREGWPDEVVKPRSVQAIQNKIKSLQQAVANHEAEQGATLEEISREVTIAQEEYDDEKQKVNAMMQLNKTLGNALELRKEKWQSFRTQIAIRCKYQFQFHLMNRGFFGKILFDHLNYKLSLRVQTEDAQTQAQQNGKMKDKDPKSLSGGEKSFSTICLLLALWEAIGCPIRCLDEFDVFMDAVNRRVSMK